MPSSASGGASRTASSTGCESEDETCYVRREGRRQDYEGWLSANAATPSRVVRLIATVGGSSWRRCRQANRTIWDGALATLDLFRACRLLRRPALPCKSVANNKHACGLLARPLSSLCATFSIKNSWGESWGESGFFKLRRSTDEIAAESMAVRMTPVAKNK